MRVRTVLAAAGIAAGTVLTATTATTATHAVLSATQHSTTSTVTRPAADREVAERLAAAGVTTSVTAQAVVTPTAQRPATGEASRGAARHRPAKHHRGVVRRHRTQRGHHRARHSTHGRRHATGRHHHLSRHGHHASRHHDHVGVRHEAVAHQHHPTLRRAGRRLTLAQKINRVIAVARSQRGKPYVWGAAGPHAFDCSGYVQWVYRRALGVHLPKYTDTQYDSLAHIRASKLRRGDLIFVREGRHESHVGIYAGNHRWWVAPHTGSHIQLQRIWPARHVFARVLH